MSFIMNRVLRLFPQHLPTEAKRNVLFNTLGVEKLITGQKRENCLENILPQEADSSQTSSHAGTNMRAGLPSIWTFIHCHLITTFRARSVHISHGQSLTVQEDFHQHLLQLQESTVCVSWVSPEKVLLLEGKGRGKQDTSHPQKWFCLGIHCRRT